MRPVTVQNVKIGEGIPKICIPIMGRTKEEILASAGRAMEGLPDVAEWRVDWFLEAFQTKKVLEVLGELRRILCSVPLLFTFRTAKEGGEQMVLPDVYEALNVTAAGSGLIDIADLEVSIGEEVFIRILRRLRAGNVRVIASSHNFEKTPERKLIIEHLCRMQALGADMIKLAVMPKSKQDVLTLLMATEEMVRCHATVPVITMSMSDIGLISRICGEFFGSALTFGSGGCASAPGQIPADKLRGFLEELHESV